MLITKGPLHRVLKKLANFVIRGSAGTDPVVALQADRGLLAVSSGDDRTRATCTVYCKHGDLGNTALPLRELLEFIKPDDRGDRDSTVEVRPVEDGRLLVAKEGAYITPKTVPTARFSAVTSEEHFFEDACWRADELAGGLDFVLPVTKEDDQRTFMTAVFLDFERLVATDGHRLHIAKLPGPQSGSVLVDRSALRLLRDAMPRGGHVRLMRGRNSLRFTVREWVIDTRPLDVVFPAIDRVIPPTGTEQFSLLVDGRVLSAAAVRMSRPRSRRVPNLELAVNGQIEVRAAWTDEARPVTVPVLENGHLGEPFVLGINRDYLLDALVGTPEVVRLAFGGPLDPLVVTPSVKRLAVVMPVRL